MKRNLDKLDKQILECLYEDVRVSNRKIAGMLDITEATVRARIRRMKNDRLVRFTAAVDTKIFANPVGGFIGVNTHDGCLRTVCTQLAALPELNFVAAMLGRYDIICTFNLQSSLELRELLERKIPIIEGVRNTEAVQALQVYKFDRHWSVLETASPPQPAR
jgi:Lrp/AsnC family transcriptional regulator for asnA, asnC and gidA